MRAALIALSMCGLLSQAEAAVASASCAGDCSGDGAVTVNELILGVTIALGVTTIDQCPSIDANGDGKVGIGELIGAVNAALGGCADVGRD